MNESSLVKNEYFSGKYYAIQLNNSSHRSWKEQDNNFSTVKFDWSEIHGSIHENMSNLTIEVAKAHPEQENGEIRNLVAAVRNTSKIRKHDRILGVENQTIKKLGFIENKNILDGNEVILTIQWARESDFGEVNSKIFHESNEIQQLKSVDLSNIERQFGNSITRIYENLHGFKDDLGFQSYESHSASHEIEKLNYILPAKEDKGGKIKIFYATNREVLQKKGNIQSYGSNSGNELQYGHCEVQIPMGHIQGELERPGKIILWSLPEDENEHVIIKSVEALDDTTFLKEFKKHISGFPKKNALLFVHGYNTSFEDAARRTAQLAWDLPFDGYAGFFSWPSSGKLPDYLSDEAKARSSAPEFELFLQQILTKTDLEHLHIVAHSMGSLVLTLSLNLLRRNPLYVKELIKIQQLILGAPDIDQEEFRNTILPEFKMIGQRRTIYASDHDKALNASSFVRRKRLRLGQIGDEMFLDKNVDTVEASNILSQNSHSYIFESKILLSDIYYLLTQGLSPIDRRLREITKNNLPYWLFPK